MQPQTASVSTKRLWTGRILSGLIVLFLLFDSITKIMKIPPVLEATIRLGYPVSAIQGIGIVLLACAVLYTIPRTSILGAILLTGYLGGATATQVRVSSPLFETIFPVVFGALVWLGIFLRDDRLHALVPLRREPAQ